ncbi:MAG TPA: Ku protein [Candidatus Saccharimonadales bacterium]|nr:Ku protein [Candidatus Saccharimonadales bacterium]
MATSVWKGFITFGLLSIPIRLFAAARTDRISLNQLHSVCNSRIKMPLFCPTCDRKVERSEIIKGYEYDKDQYLLFDEKELDDIEPDSSRSLEILEFVKLEEIDPLYFEASYYVAPEEGGQKAYHLLEEALEESGYSAIGKLTMHQREHTVIIRPHKRAGKGGMTLHTMFYETEIREAEYKQPTNIEVKAAEKKLAMQLIENLAAEFEPEKYRDDYQESMRALIAAKQQGKGIAAVIHPSRAPVVDLMEALKKSLEKQPVAAPKKPPVRSITSVPSAKEAKKLKKA